MRAISESASRVRKALMGGDQHVGECEQARQFIIVQDLAGEILKENALFFFVHVESHAPESTGFQRLDQRLCVDERPAADVDQDRAGLHQLERFAPDDVVRHGRKRCMQRDHFALAREHPARPTPQLDLGLTPPRGIRIIISP